jgi:glycosyltransferase involved in cell wall biosynthesis
MKLVILAGVFPPTPLAEANHALHLADAMGRRGIEVEVLTTRGAHTEGLGFRVAAVMRDWSWRDAPRLVRFLKSRAPDAILLVYIGFAFGDHPMVTFAPGFANAVAPLARFGTQFEGVMGSTPAKFGLVSRMIRKAVTHWTGPGGVSYEFGTLFRDSDPIIVLGAQHAAKIAELDPGAAAKTVLIPPPPLIRVCDPGNGRARAAGREQLGIAPDEFVVTYFGYLYPFKGVETLLRAVAHPGGRRFRLVIAGGVPVHLLDERIAYVDELKALAESLGLGDRVTWTGFLPWDGDEASLYLHAADCCALPFDVGVSLNNSTFAAAAAHSLPTVTTRGAVLEPAFRDGENVLLVPPRDPAALAAAIGRLIDQPVLRSRLSSGIARMQAELFTWDTAADRLAAALAPRG